MHLIIKAYDCCQFICQETDDTKLQEQLVTIVFHLLCVVEFLRSDRHLLVSAIYTPAEIDHAVQLLPLKRNPG